MSSAPDYVQPVVAWRVWRVVESAAEFQLQSVVYGTVWPTHEPMAARCFRHRFSFLPWRKRDPHAPPAEDCSCGVYAATLQGLVPYLDAPDLARVQRVLGRVSLWGSVVECEQGWRASRAYPTHIYVPAREAKRARAAAVEEIALSLTRYGVPVEILEYGRGEHLLDVLQEVPELGACA